MRLQRILLGLRTLLFVYVSAAIAVVFSERVFWFWTPTAIAHVEGAFYYSLPMAVVIGAIAWFRVSSGWGLLLIAPLYAYVTEGVLTPIIYTGGPFIPFFPAWFAAWHGVGAVFLLWFCLRRWLLAGRWKAVVAMSCALGAFWGVWASTLRLPEQVDDPEMVADAGELVVLGPLRFGLYVTMCVAFLAGSHILLGWVWPRTLAVGRRSIRTTTFVVLLGAAMWTFAVPWALPMFVGYGWLQIRALRRSAAGPPRQSLIESMYGRIRLTAVLPLALIVPVASLSYLLVWQADPSDSELRAVYFGTIALQTVGGAVVTVLAWRRAAHSMATRTPKPPAHTNLSVGEDRHQTRTIGT